MLLLVSLLITNVTLISQSTSTDNRATDSCNVWTGGHSCSISCIVLHHMYFIFSMRSISRFDSLQLYTIRGGGAVGSVSPGPDTRCQSWQGVTQRWPGAPTPAHRGTEHRPHGTYSWLSFYINTSSYYITTLPLKNKYLWAHCWVPVLSAAQHFFVTFYGIHENETLFEVWSVVAWCVVFLVLLQQRPHLCSI